MGVTGNVTFNESNYTNATVAPSTAPGFPTYLDEPLAATIFQITLWSTIAFVGVIGNLLVCLVILRRLRKTSMNYYLLSLAMADLGVLLMIYPVAVCKYLKPFKWLLGKGACLYMMPTNEIFFGASIWSITAIAIERYRNIVGAKRYQFWKRSGLKTAIGIFAVWLASFLVSSVPLYPVMTYEPTTPFCYPNWSDKLFNYTYNIALVIVWYVLPLAVIIFTYVKIKERVRDSVAFRASMVVNDNDECTKMPESSSSTRLRREKRKWRKSNKTRRILTPLVILFAVTMFPLNFVRVLALIKEDIWKNKYYNLVTGLMGLFVIINSSANPLVYYITSQEFKEAFNGIFKGLRERKNVFKQFRRSSVSSVRFSSFAAKEVDQQSLTNRHEQQQQLKQQQLSLNETIARNASCVSAL